MSDEHRPDDPDAPSSDEMPSHETPSDAPSSDGSSPDGTWSDDPDAPSSDETADDRTAQAAAAADGRGSGTTGPRSASRSSTISRVLVVVAVVAVVAGLYADAELALDDGVVELTAEDAPNAGITTCAVLGVEGGSDVTVTTLVDEVDGAGSATDATADGADAAGAATVEQVLGVERETVLTPGPGSTARRATSVDAEAIVTARWDGAPLLLGRRVTSPDGARVAGAVEGGCPVGAASRWLVPGVVTAGGASATLHLANPTAASASVAVTFTTPEGRIEPTRLGNVVVPPGERRVVDLNEFAPEQPDLGVEVAARSGRLVVEAVQQLEAAVGDVDGRSLVTAETAPAETWTVPWVDGSERAASWLWVTNAGDAPTEVRLVLHGPEGPLVPPGAGTTLSAGQTQRIDLRGVLDGAVGAVTVRSAEGEPIVIGGAVLRAGLPPSSSPVAPTVDDADPTSEPGGDEGLPGADEILGTEQEADGDAAERGGIAIVTASTATAARSATVVDVVDDRPRTLWLANPSERDATGTVSLVAEDGAVLASSRPVSVAAGASAPLELALPTGAVAVVLDVEEGQLAGTLVTAAPTGPLELTATTLTPISGDAVLVLDSIRRDRSLLHPIDLGEQPSEPVDLDDLDPLDEDAPIVDEG